MDPQDCSWIKIPNEYQIQEGENAKERLIDFIYDKETKETPTAYLLQENAIICPKMKLLIL